jgi:N,N'-diacetyllegionaminate synthase
MSVIIIAEAGVNHNGSIVIAKQLIDAAADAGVDYVKFQTFVASKLVSKHAKKAEYQNLNTDSNESQLEMIKKLELNLAQHNELLKYANEKKVKFLSTAFDLESIDLLKKLGVTLGKIPSGEITNYPYLVKMANNFDKIIISTGMSTLPEIKDAIDVMLNNGKSIEDITVLHCNTEYPTPMSDVNLLAMQGIREQLNVKVGYSDHTLGIEIPIAAVALGAIVIEKHITLNKQMEGPDHAASIEPDELRNMVKAIRNIEKALGNPIKEVTDSERKNMVVARKSIVAAVEIKKGEKFSESNLDVKRPGNGISPMSWLDVIGRTAKRDFNKDDLIEI